MDELEYFIIPGDEKTVVLIHDGIGCCSLWKDFPTIINKETGHSVFMYSRHGYGNSPKSNKLMDYNNEIDILHTILLQHNIKEPILFGHSCGAVISLLYASKYTTERVVITAPYLKYDQIMRNGIAKILHRFETGKMQELNQAHKDVDSMIYTWYTHMTNGDFDDNSIITAVEKITTPIFCIKYTNDPYFDDSHLVLLKESNQNVNVKLIEGSVHTIHKREPYQLMEFLK